MFQVLLMSTLSPPPPPPPPATLENYTPEEHLPGYTAALEDFMLLPKSTRVSLSTRPFSRRGGDSKRISQIHSVHIAYAYGV